MTKGCSFMEYSCLLKAYTYCLLNGIHIQNATFHLSIYQRGKQQKKRCIREELGRNISHNMCTNVYQYVSMCSNMYKWVPMCANVKWCVPICANVCCCVPSLVVNCTFPINRWFNWMATLHLKVFPMERPSCRIHVAFRIFFQKLWSDFSLEVIAIFSRPSNQIQSI